LQQADIHTASDLAQINLGAAPSKWSGVLEKTVRELQGTPCFTFNDQPQPKQHIAIKRSFGRPVTYLVALEEAITTFACQAA
jgi:DNA polymerase V